MKNDGSLSFRKKLPLLSREHYGGFLTTRKFWETITKQNKKRETVTTQESHAERTNKSDPL